MNILEQQFGGVIFGGTIFLTVFLLGIGFDKIDITTHTSFEQEYKGCQQKLSYFEEQQQVVCKAEQPDIILPMLSGFIAGGFSVGWLILFGYPIIKDKLEERKKVKEK